MARALAALAALIVLGSASAAAPPPLPNFLVRDAPGISPALSPDAARIAYVATAGGKPDLYVTSAAGPRRLTTSPFLDSTIAVNDAGQTSIAWSPDGGRIAFDAVNATGAPECSHNCLNWRVFVINADGTGLQLVAESAMSPAWSPSGSKLAFESGVNPFGEAESASVATLGTHSVVKIGGNSFEPLFDPPAWSARGELVAFQETPSLQRRWIAVSDPAGKRKRRIVLGEHPVWSPSGLRLAYVRAGHLFLTTVDPKTLRAGTQLRICASGDTATLAAWSPNGKRLAFLNHDRNVMVVNADGTGERRINTVRRVWQLRWSRDSKTVYAVTATAS